MMNSWPALPRPTQRNQVGGHEGVGSVVKFGPGEVPSFIKLGGRVGIKWVNWICGSCSACLDGHDGLCSSQKISGYYTPGTFQQYVVAPANYLTPIPKDLPSDLAAPMLCAGVTAYSALGKSGARSGDWVVMMGAGGGVRHAIHYFCLHTAGPHQLTNLHTAGTSRLSDRFSKHGDARHWHRFPRKERLRSHVWRRALRRSPFG